MRLEHLHMHLRPQCARLRQYLGSTPRNLLSASQSWHSRRARYAPTQRRCFETRTAISAAVAAVGASHINSYPATKPLTVPRINAQCVDHSTQQSHVYDVHEQLRQHGILKICLGFPDPDSQYLTQLIFSLHKHVGHQLPISHSASRGWFWDVRPESVSFQTANHRARSETMEDFPWHTDCSYEELPPRYFALQVLQHDRFGGGTLSAMNIQRLSESLSPSTQASLMREEYVINIPMEFIKDPAKREIVGSLMTFDEEIQSYMMRFRRDILKPLTERAAKALEELDDCLRNTGEEASRSNAQSTVHLTASDFPTGTVVLMDNRRWLHARNNIKDPERHLRRVRWDAIPFPSARTVERMI